MKKMRRIVYIMLIIVITVSSYAFAGMADWDDKTADEEANNQLQEQKNELSNIVDKSNNNYLSSLEVKGYELEPKFDKQTLNYNIGQTEKESIEIKATAEDEKATVNGTGTINIKQGENDIRVDVVAESGTTRTYHIIVNRKTDNSVEEVVKDTQNEIQNEVPIYANVEPDRNLSDESNEDNKNILILVGIIAVFAIIIIFAIKEKKK